MNGNDSTSGKIIAEEVQNDENQYEMKKCNTRNYQNLTAKRIKLENE